MTLINSFSESSTQSSCIAETYSDWNSLYCSHLWNNSNLREAIINAPSKEAKHTKYCYTCRGKIRKYGVTPPKEIFLPNSYSTPKFDVQHVRTEIRTLNNDEAYLDSLNRSDICPNRKTSISDINVNNDGATKHIPTISRQIEASFRNKYRSTNDVSPNLNRRRLRKSLKGIGCVFNWSLTKSPKKRRTQIQACSIGLMIIAILVISVVLVNYTTINHKQSRNETIVQSTIIVPTENVEINETSSAIVNYYTDLIVPSNTEISESYSTEEPLLLSTKKNSRVSNIIMKIRKNIKTYPKNERKSEDIDVINQGVYNRFCSCQTNEVCMLDEISGTSICKLAIDTTDPTGCGGLCAMETEACHLVDKSRGVRVCRLLTQVSCSSNDWRCRNGFCVPLEARCDGSIQCYDRSDEMHCECDLMKQFRCGHSISCFPKKKLCDGFIDCWDGHDELNCTMECPEDQFTCTDGQCITSLRFCDGLADCGDGSDEPQGCDSACRTHEMQCRNRRCVPLGVKCDGHDDCGDNSDETRCS